MVRPQAKILVQTQHPKNPNQEIQVVEGQGFFVVTYRDKFINIVNVDKNQKYWQNIRKYIRTGYANRAHAERLVDKLNRYFKTADFKLKEITWTNSYPKMVLAPYAYPDAKQYPTPFLAVSLVAQQNKPL